MAIAHAPEGNIDPLLPQFLLQDAHQNARLHGKAAGIRRSGLSMNRTTRALRIPPEYSQQSTAVVPVVPKGAGQVLADHQTTLAARWGIEHFADGFSLRPLPRKPQETHLRTRNLDDTHAVSHTESKEGFIDRPIAGGAGIAGILIQGAFNDSDQSSTPPVAGSETQRHGYFIDYVHVHIGGLIGGAGLSPSAFAL